MSMASLFNFSSLPERPPGSLMGQGPAAADQSNPPGQLNPQHAVAAPPQETIQQAMSPNANGGNENSVAVILEQLAKRQRLIPEDIAEFVGSAADLVATA